jgi:predicted ATPase
MPTGTMIGRDRELAELESRARRDRLVTVVGPGGVGKTALARALAERVGDSFPLGVRHVDLTRIDDERAVPGALAAQLGYDSFDALMSSPSDRPVLLVVDNCEHLLDATAASLAQILGSCRQPTVVATSRSPLELPGESVLALAPLGVPTVDGDPMSCPSVLLFLERCRDAGATLDPADLPLVAELCRRVDGLPLALEIAAARARTMSIAEIASRLAEGVDVLSRPRFRGDPRHRSVAEMIRWSYNLLRPGPAALLERLSVFSGPISAVTAQAVAGRGDAASFDGDLDELVNASLVVVDTTGPETRYRLLDTVRRFGLEQLRHRDELDAAFDPFVDHVVASSSKTLAGATTSWRPGLLRDLVASYDDLAEALRWCNAHDTSPRRAQFLCAVLWTIVHQAHAEDIAALARETLERWPDRETPEAAQAVAALATADYVTGHPERAAALAEATLGTLAEPALASVTLRRVLGQSRRALGDVDGALEAFRAGTSIGHELGMTAMAMELEVAAAQVMADDGAVEDAITELTAIVERATTAGSAITESWARTTLAWVLLRTDPSAALPVIEAALAQARHLDYPIAVAVNLRSRAFAHILLDELDAATADVTALLDDLLERGALSNARVLVDVTAVLAHRRELPAWETLVATARALPVSTMASAQFELVPLPSTVVAPVPRYAAINAVRDVLSDLAATPATSRGDAASIVQRGDVCEICFGGRTVSVRTSKGLNDLIRLIEANGREVHCLDLAGAGVEQESTGPLIDAQARRQYEERIRELQADIEDAEHDNDFARAYRSQVELDAIIDHLTAALGHGNKLRRGADTTEKARSAVTHRVRATVRQLDKLHPNLGRHLANSIKTGTYCSYQPERATSWRIS